MTATATAAPTIGANGVLPDVRYVAATTANGETYTVVLEPAMRWRADSRWDVRVEWKHAYGTDRRYAEYGGVSYERGREIANDLWTQLRDRFNGK